jgi:hypothetical protein
LQDDLFNRKQRVSPRFSMVAAHGHDAKGEAVSALSLLPAARTVKRAQQNDEDGGALN